MRFTDTRIRRATVAANFQREAGVNGGGKISFSGSAQELPLVPGVQDRVSWMVQLAAIVANSTAGQRYLRAEPPNVAETREALRDISRDAHRASNIITQIRALFRKKDSQRAPPQADGIARTLHRVLPFQVLQD